MLIMIILAVILFRSAKQALVIWVSVPLSVGLGFATVLMLFVVPVLFALFYTSRS